jgi:hypothetical protein
MKRLCVIGLAALIGVQPVLADGPLSRSAVQAAARLARDADGGTGRSSWRDVRLLDPRTPIVVTTADDTLSGRFVAIDDRWISIDRNGAVERVDLDDVEMVERQARRGSALAAVFGTLGGIVQGSMMAVNIAEGASCYRGCAAARLAVWSTIIGVPTAAGYGSWYGSSHLTEEVVYRRPSLRP